jgi:hypothetical protein
MSQPFQKKTYIVDIDKTILEGPDYYQSYPIANRIDRINSLFYQGHTVIYWTARGGTTGLNWYRLTREQLDKAGAKYTELRMGKPSYDVWIDDKAINSEDYFKQ